MTVLTSTGTVIKIGNGADPEVFTAIGQIKDISGPSFELGTEDASHHGSTWREYVPTLLDAGEVSFEIAFDPADSTHYSTTAGSLWHSMQNRIKRNFQLILPDPGAFQIDFSGYVTSFELSEPVEGLLTAQITIKLSGSVTITP